MPSELLSPRRSEAKFSRSRRIEALLLAPFVLCALSLNARAAAPERDSISSRPALLNELESMPAAGRLAFAGPRSTTLVKIGRSTVEIASEALHVRDDMPDVLPRLHSKAGAMPITGIASTYNPCRSPSGGGVTSSGEAYNPDAWTAAIQIDLRSAFGGVRYGRNYRPTFALVTSGEKSAIVRINDVGPLRPGRVIDLNERAMRYFDNTLTQGILDGVKVSPLPGGNWRTGAIDGGPAVGMAGDFPRNSIH